LNIKNLRVEKILLSEKIIIILVFPTEELKQSYLLKLEELKKFNLISSVLFLCKFLKINSSWMLSMSKYRVEAKIWMF